MANSIKDQKGILSKLGIEALNPMQKEAAEVIASNKEIVLLSPTGTGKTVAFLLPIIAELDVDSKEIQALIVVPSRELAIQIEQVIRNMGTGFKANAVYGGRAGSKDKIDLKHAPAILVGTPGRLADHLRRENFIAKHIKALVLDEFDKSLEIGFEDEMRTIISALEVDKMILTSATKGVDIPDFVGMRKPVHINYLKDKIANLKVKTVISLTKDKLETLVRTLNQQGNEPGIVFCNFKDSIQEVSDYLSSNNINHGCFYGGLEQQDRERALIKFRNGTNRILLATDLAARGIDVPEITFIIHYQLPPRKEEFLHRNGRTARMNAEGTAFVLKWEKEQLPAFIDAAEGYSIEGKAKSRAQQWQTVFVSGGRKDKISKGDLAGMFFKQGHLEKDELGVIELKQDCAFVAVSSKRAKEVIELVNNTKLKKKKVRVKMI